VIYKVDPEFSDEARRSKYQGTVLLRVIIGVDGKPHDISVVRSLGMGLDEKAVEAARLWRFEPALRDGRPVPVEVNMEVGFHLY
jgi:TonB family protein